MDFPTPTFSIIIPTYQRYHELCQCLQCLSPYFDPEVRRTHGISLEVIVSDDARDSHLCELLEQLYPWCRYTAGPASGPAANRNHGAHQASGDWLVFTDDDCLPQPGWIETFAEFSHYCDVMEGKTSPVGVRTRADEECPINETGGYLWSCNFAIRRKLFLQLGGFNEKFTAAAMEDVELNKRINKTDLRRQFLPTAQVKHPWRRRKGRNYVYAHAQSVGIYVGLHPESAPSFFLFVQFIRLLRSLKRSHEVCRTIGTVQGLSRQIGLDAYSAYATWRAVKQVRSTANFKNTLL